MHGTKKVPDIINTHLKVLFCGINPGLYSAQTGYHFARPGNRFWKTLYLSGFTPKQFDPSEQEKLVDWGLGITNFVQRPSLEAADLSEEEIEKGGKELIKKIKKYQPEFLAILGIQAYRIAFNDKRARVGLQEKTINLTKIYLLPNPSGLNAAFKPNDFIQEFKKLKALINTTL